MRLSILFFLLSLISTTILAQPTHENAVQCWLDIEDDESSVRLQWLSIPDATSYRVFRKEPSSQSWVDVSGEIVPTAMQFIDSDIEEGKLYDYYVSKTGDFNSYGYLHGGIKIPADHYSQTILLLVDSFFVESLSTEIDRLEVDMRSEGWKVIRENIHRDSSVVSVKTLVKDIYNNNDGLRSIFCLGHIPVPYSGNYAYDGHTNHVGAWPADGFYAEMTSTWNDLSVNNVTASQTRNHNIPGDGKYDHTGIPSDLELEIGRVDFYDLPLFEDDETELMRKYLEKDHKFRIGEITADMRAVIDDNFGTFGGEAFAASAWKSFGPLVKPENVQSGDYRISMNAESYMWSYGCGGGSYTSASGIGTTANFAADSLQGIFSSLFGSYFGDWDSKNNFMRASLAQGTVLTSCWNGRPHWFFHHMGMGKTIGYSAKLSMNNNFEFFSSSFLTRRVHMGLMGDPTLKMFIIDRPENLQSSFDGFNVDLSWTASSDSSIAYYIYRAAEGSEDYEILNEEPITGNTYADVCVESSGIYSYLLRATKLELTPSGSFYNLSSGIFTEIEVEITLPVAAFEAEIMNGNLSLTNNSLNSTSWLWDFGDMNSSIEFEPLHVYEVNGEFIVSLSAFNDCFDNETETAVQAIITELSEFDLDNVHIFPNPIKNRINVYGLIDHKSYNFEIISSDGRIVTAFKQSKSEHLVINCEHLDSGLYFLRITNGKESSILEFIKP